MIRIRTSKALLPYSKIFRAYIVLFLWVSWSAFSQEENDKRIYFDSLWRETENANYTYSRLIKDYFLDKDSYEVTDYYGADQVQMTGTFTDRDAQIKIGEFTWYYSNGNKQYVIHYELGEKPGTSRETGLYAQWYESGKKRAEGMYVKAAETAPRLRVDAFWDTDGVQKVTNGNGEYVELDRSFEQIGMLKNGFKDGVWKGYGVRENKAFTFIDQYKDGQFISGEMNDDKGVTHRYDQIVVQPKPKKGINDFYAHVGKNFKFPRKTDGISGRMLLQFEIDKNGEAVNIRMLKSLHEALDQEAMRLVKIYPDWEPGKFRGMAARASYTLPISIVSPD